MSFNGAGVFLINSAGNPVVTGTTISSTWLNALTADLATGLTNTITRDGQSVALANIPFGGFKATGIGLATATGDALSYGRNATVAAFTATGTTTLATTLNGFLLATSGVVSAGTNVTVATSWANTMTISGSSSAAAEVVTNGIEPVTIVASAATGTINLYAAAGSILYYTSNSSANFTLNLSFSSTPVTLDTVMSVGQCITLVFMNTNGGTPHYANVIKVDGATVTPKWQVAAPSAGFASGIDVYTFSVIKTGSATFVVLASLVPFA